jgi:hypothetical protein
MAVCDYCDQEMMDKVSCKEIGVEYDDGKTLPQIRHGKETRGPDGTGWGSDGFPCHDCGAPVGAFHHVGCDVEECPRCHGQLISCGCLGDDSEIAVDSELDRFIVSGALGALRNGSGYQMRRLVRLSAAAVMELSLLLERGFFENAGSEAPEAIEFLISPMNRHFHPTREEQRKIVDILIGSLREPAAPVAQICYALGKARDFPEQVVPILKTIIETLLNQPSADYTVQQAVLALTYFISSSEDSELELIERVAREGQGEVQETAAEFAASVARLDEGVVPLALPVVAESTVAAPASAREA